jgi:hypothetical protein
MVLTPVQGAPQSRCHHLADAAAFPPSLLADLADQGNGQLDGKDPFGFGNRQGSRSGLSLLKITVSLAPGYAIMGAEPA